MSKFQIIGVICLLVLCSLLYFKHAGTSSLIKQNSVVQIDKYQQGKRVASDLGTNQNASKIESIRKKQVVEYSLAKNKHESLTHSNVNNAGSQQEWINRENRRKKEIDTLSNRKLKANTNEFVNNSMGGARDFQKKSIASRFSLPVQSANMPDEAYLGFLRERISHFDDVKLKRLAYAVGVSELELDRLENAINRVAQEKTDRSVEQNRNIQMYLFNQRQRFIGGLIKLYVNKPS